MNPGQTFTKTWELRNVGTCPWTTSYQLVYFSGEQMGAATTYAFSENVPVGKTARFSVPMTAPSTAGSYRGYWMFKNANGDRFGWGPQGNRPWWVDIDVTGPTVTPGGPSPTPSATPTGPTPTPIANSAYDFVAEACNASWFSGAGALPCPGSDGDAKGFVVRVINPKLESGATDSRPGLLTFPQNVQNGYIQGIYPAFTVQTGDRFRSTINCEGGATLCYVAFRLDYKIGDEPIRTLWGPFLERYEGLTYPIDLNLNALAGKNVRFILTVLAAGTATGDRALWVGPHIYRPGGATLTPVSGTISPTATSATSTATSTGMPSATATATSTVTATATATAPTSSTTGIYQNTKYNFKFTLPSGASIVSQSDNVGRVSLPLVEAGTNLHEKYIQIHIVENANPCVSPAVDGVPTSTENVTLNGLQFVKTTGQGAAAGNRYDWTVYATTQNNACITLAFILHSVNPGNYSTPPPEFDMAQETAVIGTTMNTFMQINT